jgi:putative solute:sodium symporter small subunit
MTGANQTTWWLSTMRLATAVLAGFAVVACVPLLFAARFDRATFLGLPFGYFLIALATPVVLAMAVFWFAERQRELDHRYDVIED